MDIEILARTEIAVDPDKAREAAEKIIENWNLSADSEHTGSISTDELLGRLAADGEIILPDDFEIPDEWDLLLTPEEWE